MRIAAALFGFTALAAVTAPAQGKAGAPTNARCMPAAASAGAAPHRANRPATARLTAMLVRSAAGPWTVRLRTTARDPDRDRLLYTYSTTGGAVTGNGPAVTWTLDTPGTYTASVEVDDGHGCTSFASATQTVPPMRAPRRVRRR
ncbi:MAG: hypothetical protein QOH04_1977 [Sphingomonadales bacterium]|nr:hypothetical protein [Sphingomonadales bacterium]MEA3036212.1 hypothetical protein [Sphingomonadales bacterium]